jgi:AMMECR1 domain-containing protein
MIATFIGISKDGELQGSMGQIRPVGPYPVAAVKAFLNTLEDPRMQYDPEDVFDPDSGFAIKIRLLSELELVELNDVIIGKDGMVVEAGEKSAIFLPEVPTKQGWSHDQYLSELLEKGEILDGEDYSLYKFQTKSIMVFS